MYVILAIDVVPPALVDAFGESSPRILLAAIVVIVLVLGQFLSNLATVLIVAPVSVSIAQSAGLSPLPMMMAVTVAGAASFLTPIAPRATWWCGTGRLPGRRLLETRPTVPPVVLSGSDQFSTLRTSDVKARCSSG